MPRNPRVTDGTVVLLHAPEGEPREEAKVVGYDQAASRYIVELTSNGETQRVARGAFEVSAADAGEQHGVEEQESKPDIAPAHRGRVADPNSPGYQKDPEKFYYEQGYADGKRGHDFRPDMAEGHPRYTRGFAKHRPADVPEQFRSHLEKKTAKPEAEKVPA